MKTTNYEISKQLAKAGFKQETDFYWAKWNEGDPELVHAKDGTPPLIEKVLAWDLEKILETLPNFIQNGNGTENCLVINVAFGEIHYEGDCESDALFITTTRNNESLADTAARLWLELKKKKIF